MGIAERGVTSAEDPVAREFDRHAVSYDSALNEGLSLSGETKDYFAAGRIRWLSERLKEAGRPVQKVLDYGCGPGSSVPLLRALLGAERVTGVDVSREQVAAAAARYGGDGVDFSPLEQWHPDGTVDVAYCNGVFHHIPVDKRPAAVRAVWDALKPGGVFALWENNPWNPGTRYVMSRIPFDRDAVTLSAPETRRLLVKSGFTIERTDFLFIFPSFLRWLRPLEPALASLPLGGQYLVLGRRPA